MFGGSARLLGVALLVHHWDNRRGVELQHWTVSLTTTSLGCFKLFIYYDIFQSHWIPVYAGGWVSHINETRRLSKANMYFFK